MNPFHIGMCPMCCYSLSYSHTPGYYIYECEEYGHYMFSRRESGEPVKAEVHMTEFYLMYVYDKTKPYTSVFRYNTPDPNRGHKHGPYHYLFQFQGYYPLNWNVPDKSVERLKNLLVFL